MARRGEPYDQLRLAAFWLGGTLAVLFLICATLDFGVVIAAPLAGLVSLIWLLGISARGIKVARQAGTTGMAFICGLSGPAAAACAFVLVQPVIWCGNYAQAEGVLAWNISNYRKQLALEPRGSDKPEVWTYGGWLSIDRDIVHYPFGDPATRLKEMQGSANVNCRWLSGDFYDCTVDY